MIKFKTFWKVSGHANASIKVLQQWKRKNQFLFLNVRENFNPGFGIINYFRSYFYTIIHLTCRIKKIISQIILHVWTKFAQNNFPFNFSFKSNIIIYSSKRKLPMY